MLLTLGLFFSPGQFPPVSEAEVIALARQAYIQGLEHQEDAFKARTFFQTSTRALYYLQGRGNTSLFTYRGLAAGEILQGDFPWARMHCIQGLRKFPADPVLGSLSAFVDANLTAPSGLHRFGFLSSRLAIYLAGLWQVFAFWLFWIGRKRPGWVLLFFAWLVAAGHLASTRGYSQTEPVAVVNEETVARLGNSEAYPMAQPRLLAPGTVVFPQGENHGWVRIRLPGGDLAWVPSAALALPFSN